MGKKLADVPPPKVTRQLVEDIMKMCCHAKQTGNYDREVLDRLCRWNLYAATWIERVEREEGSNDGEKADPQAGGDGA